MTTLSPVDFSSAYAGSLAVKDLPAVSRHIKSHSSIPRFSTEVSNPHDLIELASGRIAQRLHDDAGQMLAVVYLELAAIERDGSAALQGQIKQVMSHLDDVTKQLRQLAYELHPFILDRHGLVPALNELAKGMAARHDLEVTIVGGDLERLDSKVETVLYRTVQEALTNVSKHAKASRVVVRLWKKQNSVHCSINDNGIGFPNNGDGTEIHAGIGLTGIHERVQAMQGSCMILSRPECGTTIQVELPV